MTLQTTRAFDTTVNHQGFVPRTLAAILRHKSQKPHLVRLQFKVFLSFLPFRINNGQTSVFPGSWDTWELIRPLPVHHILFHGPEGGGNSVWTVSATPQGFSIKTTLPLVLSKWESGSAHSSFTWCLFFFISLMLRRFAFLLGDV